MTAEINYPYLQKKIHVRETLKCLAVLSNHRHNTHTQTLSLPLSLTHTQNLLQRQLTSLFPSVEIDKRQFQRNALKLRLND